MALVNVLTRQFSRSKSEDDMCKAMQDLDLTRAPLYEGRVFKQFRNEHGFNKRYFVLYPGFILYYKHERDYQNDRRSGMVRHARSSCLNACMLNI